MAKKKDLKSRLADRRKNLSEKGNSSFHLMKDEGTYRFRVLPTGDEEKDWAAPMVTFFLGKKTYVSPSTKDLPCAIMDFSEKLRKSKKESEQKLAKNIRPRKSFVVAAIKMDSSGKEVDSSGVRLLKLPNNVYGDMLDIFLDEEDGGDFTHPTEGFDIKVTRIGTGQFDTKYSVRACKPTKLSKEYAKKTWDPLEMLDKEIISYEDSEAAVEEYLNGGDEEEETPKKKKSTDKVKKKKKKSDA